MNKAIITIISIIVVIGAILIGIKIFSPNTNNESKDIITKVAEEEILDDCTDEYEELENEKIMQANSEEEKISPYCSFTIKTYYKECRHTKNEYLKLPEELVNCTKKQIEEKYKDYKLEKFASNEIVLYQEKEGECGEHYVVKDNNGKVVVYRKTKNEKEEFIEETDIATDYLPETDKINMKKGIEVIGKQNLNQLIEDYE